MEITDLPDHGTLFLDADSDNVVDPGEVVTLNQQITWANAKTAPRVKYFGDTGYDGPDSLKYIVIDNQGGVGTVEGSALIGVGVNHAPVNAIPGTQTTSEDTALVFGTGVGNAISVSDQDIGTAPIQVQLTATNGTLNLSGLAGLTFTAGDGTDDTTMTFKGTVDAVNAALNGLLFNPTANYNGAAR